MGQAIDGAALDTLFREAHIHGMATAAGRRSDATRSLRASQVGADQRERRAGTVCVSSVE